MAVKQKTCCTPWWYNRLRQSRPSRALIPAACPVRRPMGPTAMAPRRNGPGGRGFACKRPNEAKPSRAWARFAMPWSAAIISLPSSDGCSAGSIARLVATWDGSNWPHVSSCSAQVLSRDPKLLVSWAKVELLVLDDFGLAPLTQDQRRNLLKILEDRHGTRATLVTS